MNPGVALVEPTGQVDWLEPALLSPEGRQLVARIRKNTCVGALADPEDHILRVATVALRAKRVARAAL